MAVQFEYTDTYGGESNYSWVRRTTEPDGGSDLALVRRAKKWAGINGVPARVTKYGDMIVIHPRGICTVLFITYTEAA